jgi:hypothetical protein
VGSISYLLHYTIILILCTCELKRTKYYLLIYVVFGTTDPIEIFHSLDFFQTQGEHHFLQQYLWYQELNLPPPIDPLRQDKCHRLVEMPNLLINLHQSVWLGPKKPVDLQAPP